MSRRIQSRPPLAMIAQPDSPASRDLPWVLGATLAVMVLPVLAVAGLRIAGFIASTMVSAILASLISLELCWLGAAYWKKHAGSHDLLFGDLIIWGWIRRRLTDRRVESAVRTLSMPAEGECHTPLSLEVAHRMKLLEQLAQDLEARDPYMHGHSRRVARYASLIASRLGLPPSQVAKIRAGAAVHDVGKLHTPLEILRKPTGLTAEEFAAIGRHSADGARIVNLLTGDEELTAMVLHHHERLNGTGYPSRLTGTEIPVGARVIAVADTFDAVTSERAYRSARPHRAALEILQAEAGVKLDADAVKAFRGVYSGRGPVGVVVALLDGAERVVTGLLGSAAGTAAQVAAVAATGTALLHPAPPAPPVARSPGATTHSALAAAAAARTRGAGSLAYGKGSRCCVSTRGSATARQPGGRNPGRGPAGGPRGPAGGPGQGGAGASAGGASGAPGAGAATSAGSAAGAGSTAGPSLAPATASVPGGVAPVRLHVSGGPITGSHRIDAAGNVGGGSLHVGVGVPGAGSLLRGAPRATRPVVHGLPGGG